MSKYSIYLNYPERIAQRIRTLKSKAVYIKELKKLNGMGLVNAFFQSFTRTVNLALSFKVLYGEHARALAGNPAIFLTPSDIDRLSRGKFQLTSLPADLFPFPAFSVCFPYSFEVAGKRLPGVQVSFVSNQDEFIRTANSFMRQMPDVKFFNGNDDDCLVDAYSPKDLFVSYVEPGDEEETFLNYREELLLKMINSDSYIELSQAYPEDRSSWAGCGNVLPLTESELERQYVILRTILGLCVYLKANPDALKNGFPCVRNFSLSTPFGVPTKSLNLDFSRDLKVRNSPGEHYRSWHIRQLTHERFYQHEYKDMEQGSRFVFVSDTMVNSTLNPKHVE